VSHPGRNQSAAVVGGATWNLLVDVPALPVDLRTLHASGYRYAVGGTGAGKALNLARLGLGTRLHALLGEDDDGRSVRRCVEGAGVSLTAWPDPQGTERHLNLMDPHGDRLSIFLNRSSAHPDLASEELAEVTAGVDLVFVSLTDYTRRVLPLLREAGIPVWVDLHDWDGKDSDYHRDFVDHGDYLFVSDVRLDDPLELCSRLAATRRLVVVTHGSRGATAFFPDREPFFVPAFDEGQAVDTNGAGDAFAVGVAYGRLQGWDWPRSLQAGAVVAAGCVTSVGLADPELSADWLLSRL
jgi:sugar/nucleoside kinase (ribokinase family)